MVEIGAGTGLNFRHYPAGVGVVATEPDPHMLKAARRQDRREGFHVRFAGGCHPNRDTLRAIAAAGFDTAAVHRVTLPGTKVTSPGIEGAARKPG